MLKFNVNNTIKNLSLDTMPQCYDYNLHLIHMFQCFFFRIIKIFKSTTDRISIIIIISLNFVVIKKKKTNDKQINKDCTI